VVRDPAAPTAARASGGRRAGAAEAVAEAAGRVAEEAGPAVGAEVVVAEAAVAAGRMTGTGSRNPFRDTIRR
jgi:hypothetical protein